MQKAQWLFGGQTRNRALDGLRALAALAVLMYHVHAPAFSGGALGVDVFFVLSGYIITRLLIDEKPSYAEFVARRVRRLSPALLVFVAVYLIVGPAIFHKSLTSVWLEGVCAAFYLTDFIAPFRTSYPPLSHTWSLAIEAQFYLVWPLLLPRVLRLRDPPFALFLIWATWTLLTLAAPLVAPVQLWFSPLHVEGLILGAFVALTPLSSRFAPLGLVGLVLLITCGPSQTVFTPIAEICTAALLPALMAPTRIGALFSWRPAAAFGMLSYGVYLWHVPVAMALKGSPFVVPVTLCASTIVAAISYYGIERRFRRPPRASPPAHGFAQKTT